MFSACISSHALDEMEGMGLGRTVYNVRCADRVMICIKSIMLHFFKKGNTTKKLLYFHKLTSLNRYVSSAPLAAAPSDGGGGGAGANCPWYDESLSCWYGCPRPKYRRTL